LGSLAELTRVDIIFMSDDLARIITSDSECAEAKDLCGFLNIVEKWQAKHTKSNDGFLSQVWYRGVEQEFPNQRPRVYRKEFTKRAKDVQIRKPNRMGDKRLHLECQMLEQFRSAGAMYFKSDDSVEIYVAAQHFGMPTRLLDWSMNPLIALFHACGDEPPKEPIEKPIKEPMEKSIKDGFVYAMNAGMIIPEDAKMIIPDTKPIRTRKWPRSIMSMRNWFVRYAIGLSFWEKPKPGYEPHVLPVQPNRVPGRIGQQSSCFTLHMHRAPDIKNDTLITIRIDGKSKSEIRNQLHRLNINQFTVYCDLDHLSREIKRCWLEK
jgi:FRG domain